MPSGYQILPEVYDRWQRSYGKDFSSLILPRLLQTIKALGIPTSSLLDLACGTGTLALMMAQRGWKVFGIDASEGMLKEAKRKPQRGRHPVVFCHQTMEKFGLPVPVTVTTCLFDALNHLTSPRALQRCFHNVHAALVPGGFFIFDLNNELCYRTVWRQTDVIHQKDFTMALENSFDLHRRIGNCRVTLFVRRGEVFERKTETVRERYYPKPEIGELLRRSGFEILESSDFNFTTNPLVGDVKTWWVARRGK